MVSFIGKRLAQSVVVMLAIALISFYIFNFIGDPVESMVGAEATTADREELRERLGLNDPMAVRFLRFVINAMQGDLGMSYRLGQPVSTVILERIPATVELALTSAVLALLIAIPLGVYTAIRRKSWLTSFALTGTLVGVSLPTFFIGILLIWMFAIQVPILPAFGRGQTVSVIGWETGFLTRSGLLSLILPSLTLAIYQMTLIMRMVRSEMIEILRMEFIRFARGRGIPYRSIFYRHALKNSLVPVITIVGLQLGAVIAFAVITETVFQWPGLGLLFIDAVIYADIPVMAGYLLLVGLLFVSINLVVDILYYLIDPRIRITATPRNG